MGPPGRNVPRGGGCCPGPPDRRPGGPNPQVQQDPPAPHLNWAFGLEVNLADEDARRPDMAIDLMEEAKEGDKPVVLYVETRSDERRYAGAREACEELEESLFGNYQVASRMNDHFTLIRVELEDLDRATMRKYGIRMAPQLLIFDSNVERAQAAFSGSSIRATQVARALDQVKERNDQILEMQERRARRANR